MAISDYIWPFKKKFSQIPCAREASIAALLGGPGIGAITLMLTNRGGLAFKISGYSGVLILWTTFGLCRYDFYQQTRRAEEFKEAYGSGRIE